MLTKDEDPSHPAARMATINDPFFWIFMGACILLYIYTKINAPATGNQYFNPDKQECITGAVFFNLLLNLLGPAIKNKSVKNVYKLTCHILEGACALALAIWIVA